MNDILSISLLAVYLLGMIIFVVGGIMYRFPDAEDERDAGREIRKELDHE